MGASLLERMRSGSDSTFMQVLIALVMISFLGWWGHPKGETSRTVAVVNGERILEPEYQRQYRYAAQMQEMRARHSLSDAEQKMLADQVRQDLIEGEVVLQEARSLGLTVSDTEVARGLLAQQGFRGKDGKFDPELYQAYLKRQKLTEGAFEETIRETLLREKLRNLVFMGANVSEPAIREAWKESATRIDLEYVRVRAGIFDPDVQITPESRAQWLTENAEQAQEAYDRDKQRLYDHPEMVRTHMILLGLKDDGNKSADLAARLEKLRAELAGGADFGELARRWSEDPTASLGGDQGARPVPQLPAEAASALADVAPGGISRVVLTATDVRLYRLDERTPAKVDTFEEVRDAIADRLIRAEQTPALAAAAAEAIHAKWKETGTPPTDLLEARSLVLSNTGPIPLQNQGSPFAPPDRMLGDASRAQPGDLLPEVYESNGVLWIGRLASRTEADMAEYEAKKDQLRGEFLMQRRVAFYQDWLEGAKARAKIE
jgi:peptidyl-prolyl cis-trans isomerase D